MIWTIIFAILFFSLIIFVHEFGHFITARIFGVKVHEFALGMGPKLLSWRKGETRYSLRAIPVGGFCNMEGEDQASDDEGSFSRKPWYARLIILAAGAAMNVLLGFIICTAFVGLFYSESGIPSTVVAEVVPEAPAAEFLQPGDRIVALNGQKVNIKKDIDFAMQQSGGAEGEIAFVRNGEKIIMPFKPYVAEYSDGTPAYLVGVTIKTEKPNIFNVVRESFCQTIWMGKMVYVSLGMMISGQVGVNEISGPVGVVVVMNETAQQGGMAGFINLLFLGAFISVNIGIMNLLPIPALDGGRILFVIIEAIRRKPIPPEKEGVVHFVGLLLLFGLMIFATWNDIVRMITGG